MKKIKDKIVFPIYLDEKKGYYKVVIWKNQKCMEDGLAIPVDDAMNLGFLACYIPMKFPPPITKKQKDGTTKLYIPGDKFGELHFCKEHLSAAIVSHEIQHAIFDLIYKLRWKISGPSYRPGSQQDLKCEYLCQENQRLTRSFWTKYWNRVDKIKSL